MYKIIHCLIEGEGFTSDGVTSLYEKGVFEVGVFVCFSLPLITQEDLDFIILCLE